MQDTPIATETLRDQRVKITLFDKTEKFGVLRGITAERLFLDEEPVARHDIADIEEAPLFCPSCGDSVLKLIDDVCAACYREDAKRKPAHQEPCVVCGAPGIRNPRSREKEFLCVTHHAETGRGLAVHPSVPVIAACTTEDVTSNKHEWQQVKGARFRCIRCRRAEKWDSELLVEMMKDRL